MRQTERSSALTFAGCGLPLENQLLRFKQQLRAMGPRQFEALTLADFSSLDLEPFRAVWRQEQALRSSGHHRGAL